VVLKEMINDTAPRAVSADPRESKAVTPTEEQRRCHPEDMPSKESPQSYTLSKLPTAVKSGCTRDELKCNKPNHRAWIEFAIER